MALALPAPPGSPPARQRPPVQQRPAAGIERDGVSSWRAIRRNLDERQVVKSYDR